MDSQDLTSSGPEFVGAEPDGRVQGPESGRLRLAGTDCEPDAALDLNHLAPGDPTKYQDGGQCPALLSGAQGLSPANSVAKNHVLVIDNAPDVRAILRQGLQIAGFEVTTANGKDNALRCIDGQHVDLVTLDVELGCGSGIDLIEQIRVRGNTPVIVTGRDAPFERVAALERGADDYIAEPFYIRELVMRLHGLLYGSVQRYAFDGCVLDTRRRELRTAHGIQVRLTDIEFRLLRLLTENSARVISRDMISHSLKGRDWSPLDRAIDGHIARLRRKLDAMANEPGLIKSVRGIGYVLAAGVAVV